MGEPHRQRAKRRVSKETKLRLRVVFLDDTERTFEVESKVLGGGFYNGVCDHLKLLEKEYFGLEFRHHNGSYVWLEMLKPLAKQIKYNNDLFFRFIVKFFPPDPGQLKRALTRYMFALQIKQDLSNGSLTCNDNSAALLVSHILQSELGDYEEELVCHHLQMKQYVPNQEYLDHKILRFHKKHRGASPADSDRHLLEVVRRLEMYGIRPHAAHDGEGMRLTLAVTHSGVLVFQGNTKINTFSWAKIRKLSFKRKNFIIKLHETVGPSHKDAVLFSMASRDVCKSFWKMCVEYHAFFRLERELQPDRKTVLTCRGSSFRYSGRTQKQLLESSGSSEIKHTHFERVYSQSDYDPRQCRSSPDLLTDESKQLKGSVGGALAPPTRGDLRGGAKRSQSSGEVSRSPCPLLWRAPPPSSPGTRQPSPAPKPRSTSVYGDDDEDAGGGRSQARRLAGVYGNRSRYGNRPRLFSGAAHPQQLVLLFPPGGTAPSLPIFPLPGNAPASSLDYLHQRRHRPRLSAGVTDGSLPPRRPPAAVPGHYSDDSTFLPGLPRRSASQPDVQRNPPRRAASSTFDPASEFRPLGYYPHLTRPRPRPTHLPLLPPLPDTPPWGRPASLCVIGGAGEAGRGGSYSDPEVLYPYYYYCCGHLVAGPGAAGLTRMTFSSGSLQLEEEEEEQEEVGWRGEVRVAKITL